MQNGYSDIAVYLHKNDTAGNQIETRYLGAKMELIRIEFIGPAIVKRKFNNLNQKIEEAFFDENNKYLQDLAKVVWTYDNKGNETSKTLYNAKELEGTK